MTQNTKAGHFILQRKFLWLAGAIALLVAIAAIKGFRTPDMAETQVSDQPTYTVRQGPLLISVNEAGSIRPREQIILKNEVEGQTVILYVIEEGREVNKGDLLVELDVSKLEDERVNQQIQVINGEASFINVRENLEVVKSQAQADVDKAALDLEFASQDLEQYQKGEYPKQEKEALAKITLAEETLTNAKNTFDWSQKLFGEKYLSETELKKDELAWKKGALDLELARDALNLLQKFTYKRQMAELQSNLKQAGMALERITRKVAADIAQAEARLNAGEAEFQQQKDKLHKIDLQIGKTKIYAPMAGTVIYASSTKMDRHSSQEPLDEGQIVRERQELIYLPTSASYNAEIKVHEASLKKIRVGLPVRITIDALPGKNFTGRIASIAPLPDATSMFMNPDLKIYASVIEIDGNGADLRNGMSCQAEIVVERFDKAVYVPVQAVIQVGGKPTIYVQDGQKFMARPVTIGLDNNRMIHVIEGLASGETVLLTPPLAAGERKAETLAEEMPVPDFPTKLNTPPTAPEPRQSEQSMDTSNRGAESPKTGPSFNKRTPEEQEAFRQKMPGKGAGGRQSSDRRP